ncbi:transposase%2C degenerate [Mycobacterium tuberculosis]|nr:transposase%2C degenerate [Mycobacterium tuberculosis]CKU78477.1 transposase%2C degenerate [Mycobacterium tuberculosis]
MSDATTVLFGLPGARVERVERRSDGTRVVDVITDEPTAAACPSCGGGLDISEGIRGYLTERSTLWRRPHHGALEQNSLAMPRRLLQAGAVHRGHHPGTCPRPQHAAAASADGQGDRGCGPLGGPRSPRLTPCRGRRHIGRLLPTPRRVLPEPLPTPVLGVDQTRRGKPRWERCAKTGRWVRVDPWDTGFVDLAGDQGFMGQHEGRGGAAVLAWLQARTPQFRESIQYGGHRPRRCLRLGDPHARAAAQRQARRRPLPCDHAGQRRADRGAPPGDLGVPRPARPQDRPAVGQPTSLADRPGTLVGQKLRQNAESDQRRRPPRADSLGLDRQRGAAHPAVDRAHRRGPPPGAPSPTPLPAWRIDSQIPELLTLATTID